MLGNSLNVYSFVLCSSGVQSFDNVKKLLLIDLKTKIAQREFPFKRYKIKRIAISLIYPVLEGPVIDE